METAEEIERTKLALLNICTRLGENDPTVRCLDLSAFGNSITWQEAELICNALQGNTHVNKLALVICKSEMNAGVLLLLLVSFLATFPGLQTFTLTDGGDRNVRYQDVVSSIIKTVSFSKSLTRIELVDIHYDRPQVLETLLSKTQTLKELEFSAESGCGNDSENFCKVCESLRLGFQQNQTLESIKFTSKLGPHVETALFGMFDLSTLQSLTLDVLLTGEVSQVLGCSFKYNETIRSLDLTLRTTDQEHVPRSALAPVLLGLAYNRGIAEVQMKVSAQQPFGAAAWTELFQKNKTMTSFELLCDTRAVEPAPITAIAKGLCDNVSLQKLFLADTLVPTVDAFDGAAWQTMIQTNRSLKELCLQGSSLGYDVKGQASFKLFTLGLAHNTSLKKLDMGYNLIGVAGGDALADALARNETLEYLKVACSDIDGEEGQAVLRKLWSNKGLQHLDCADNKFGGLGRAFAGGLPKNHTLKQINLRECSLDSDDCRAIFESLHGNKVLVELIMYDNEATLDGSCVTALTELLASTPLRKLDLQDNAPNSDFMTQLTDCLKGNTSLTHLDLSYCGLGNAELLQLAEALVENTTLSNLLLDANDFDQDSCCGFMQLLPQMKGLKQLTIDSSLFNRVLGLALVEGLKGNKSLGTIGGLDDGLDDMDLPSAMKKSIEFYLKMNRNGRRFLQESKDEAAVPLPFGAWPLILARMTSPSERDELFHFLRHKGNLVQ